MTGVAESCADASYRLSCRLELLTATLDRSSGLDLAALIISGVSTLLTLAAVIVAVMSTRLATRTAMQANTLSERSLEIAQAAVEHEQERAKVEDRERRRRERKQIASQISIWMGGMIKRIEAREELIQAGASPQQLNKYVPKVPLAYEELTRQLGLFADDSLTIFVSRIRDNLSFTHAPAAWSEELMLTHLRRLGARRNVAQQSSLALAIWTEDPAPDADIRIVNGSLDAEFAAGLEKSLAGVEGMDGIETMKYLPPNSQAFRARKARLARERNS